ncbi:MULTISPECIES: NUDIX hydrolase [unclassified Streptomyces]|uniref:NUDIX hydrolase n=1 Tax=unclassified Streptomyces TaxID=2593676 RepID=UPI002256C755|nr:MULTISPECIES: NUDIX domain-containing protein [unclassified Streptomyces]MCX4863483.1 NUDIX domain-containing protein [Streptomyces sp. NBC_00906]MCX4894721.1 NUDIX domain-containing protein [Streptomyces sp. NBC_00892]
MTETDEQQRISTAIIADGDRVLMIRRRVKEGKLSWAFPGGGIEAGETPEQAAVRETVEEVELEVKAVKVLGERVHPNTGRHMTYVACEPIAGEPAVGDEEEIAEVAWVKHADISTYVPYGLFGPVQEYLDGVLTRSA